jgi:hypothetical protein
VVVGSDATGLPAAIVAREAGASVIVVEVEPDIGGHAITSGGNVPLGGGNSAQRAHGIGMIRFPAAVDPEDDDDGRERAVCQSRQNSIATRTNFCSAIRNDIVRAVHQPATNSPA